MEFLMYGLTFGVEIECAPFKPEQLFELALSSESLIATPEVSPGIFGFRYGPKRFQFRGFAPHFTIKNDGSISPSGCEVVSSILSTEQDLSSLKTLVTWLRSVGASTNSSCGLHVHVGIPKLMEHEAHVRDLWNERGAFGSLMYGNRVQKVASDTRDALYLNWQQVLPHVKRSFNPLPERERRYAKLNFERDTMNYDRYCGLNATFSHHPTAEFRLFNPALNFRYLCRAIRVACGVTRMSIDSRLIEIKPHQSLESYLEETLGEAKPLRSSVQ